jgi:hypothetical protein
VVEDLDIKEVLLFAKNISTKHITFLPTLFENEKMATPQGFTDTDWNKGAPRLYADVFNLRYLEYMGRGGMSMYALAKATSSREDIRNFFTECLIQASELYDKTIQVMLEKGILVRSPIINPPKSVEFVQKQHFLSAGFFSDKRPLLANEIAHLASNIETNCIGKTLLLGFSQTAIDKQAKNYLVRGVEIAKKSIEIFSSILKTNNLPSPSTWDSTVTESTSAPFSEKLMLFHVSMLNSMGLSNYGTSLGASMRMDLATHYTRLIAEIGKYAEDGTNLMIAKGWMEKPPQTVDREDLINKNSK